MSAPLAAPPAADPVTVTEAEAARLASLSGKTLKRLADAGEPVGRQRFGRAVRYNRRALVAYLEARSAGR